jgi:excisionase family DNA binding protein
MAAPIKKNNGAGKRKLGSFYRIADVAAYFDVSLRTVRRWIANKDLVAHEFGGVRRIAEADVLAFAARHRRN